MPVLRIPIPIASKWASIDTSICLIVSKCSIRSKIIRASVNTKTSLIISIEIPCHHINIGSKIGNICVKGWASVYTKSRTWISEVVLVFWAKWNTQVCAVISIFSLNTVGWDCFAVRLSMDISPCALLAKSHANMLSDLGEPYNTINYGAERNT